MPGLKRIAGISAAAIGLAVWFAGAASATELQFFGQSGFKIVTPGGKTILIDPFITKNPKTPDALKDLDKLGPVDLVLLTHGHGDHIGDTPEIAKRTGAKVALNADMGHTLRTLGMVSKEQLIRFNKSGPISPLGDGITITMVHAEHSSDVLHVDPETGENSMHPGGEPAGFIIELENGFKIYHAGDTGVFGDMVFIGSYYKPDLSLVPIGGHFTMDPVHAAYAVKELLKVDKVIPIHYGTFPLLKGTPEEFKAALGDAKVEVIVMEPGETLEF